MVHPSTYYYELLFETIHEQIWNPNAIQYLPLRSCDWSDVEEDTIAWVGKPDEMIVMLIVIWSWMVMSDE